MIPLSIPHLDGNEQRYVADCIQSGWISSAGPYVNRFELEFAKALGVAHAVACSSGTSALHIALLLAGVASGDEVLVPTVTFIAPVNTVRYVGAYPVFMDCDDHLNMDVKKVEQFLLQNCKWQEGRLVNIATHRPVTAIIPVHIFGHPVDMDYLMAVAEKFQLKVVEDATESLGSFYTDGKYCGKKTGTIGQMGCFSFNGNKIISTGGGGMIVTDDAKLAERAQYLTTQAKDDAIRFVHHEVGYNYRLTNVQAALGLAQLERLGDFLKIKRDNFRRYHSALHDFSGCQMISEPPRAQSNYWHYSLVLPESGADNADIMVKMLEKKGVQARPLWYLNHLQRPYRGCEAFCIEKAPVFHRRLINIPCSVGLSDTELNSTVSAIQSCFLTR